MKEINLGIVILHYNTIDDTVQCVESFINNLDIDNYVILIFDNCSPNKSGLILKTKYQNNERIHVHINEDNIGFGRGNNKGISILRDLYNPKFIVLSNNDIILLEKELYKKIEAEYSFSGFAELGPMIKTPDGRNDSNPIFDYPYTEHACKWNLKVTKRKLIAYRLHLLPLYMYARSILYKIFPYYVRKRPLNRKNNDLYRSLKRRENIICHGSFIILSRVFFMHYDGIDVRSFMYGEEDILYMQIKSKHLKIVYNPSIIVFHKEGSSVKAMNKNRKKTILTLSRYIQAEKGYLRFLKELNNN